jgi:hypothetical protein
MLEYGPRPLFLFRYFQTCPLKVPTTWPTWLRRWSRLSGLYDSTREHQMGEVSLHCWPPVWVSLFCKKNVSCHTADSKPVKQEVDSTVILPPLVFPDTTVGQRHLSSLSGLFTLPKRCPGAYTIKQSEFVMDRFGSKLESFQLFVTYNQNGLDLNHRHLN